MHFISALWRSPGSSFAHSSVLRARTFQHPHTPNTFIKAWKSTHIFPWSMQHNLLVSWTTPSSYIQWCCPVSPWLKQYKGESESFDAFANWLIHHQLHCAVSRGKSVFRQWSIHIYVYYFYVIECHSPLCCRWVLPRQVQYLLFLESCFLKKMVMCWSNSDVIVKSRNFKSIYFTCLFTEAKVLFSFRPV